MGGASIFHIREKDPNFNVILEMMTDYSTRYIMAQRYLPEIKQGDKRILLVNGEPIAYALARIPTKEKLVETWLLEGELKGGRYLKETYG